MDSVAIVRERGQVTIPKSIRKKYSWVRSNAAVSFIPRADDEISIKPSYKSRNEKPDWEKIWRLIRLSRSFKGKIKGHKNLSQFIIEDRERH